MMRWDLRDDRGAALPLVILMVVLLGLSLASASALTQSAGVIVRTNAVQQQQRDAAVSNVIARVLEDLSPASGRILGIDPAFDPAGSCVGALGPYTLDDGRVISVDCVQASGSGWPTSLSSLVLVGTGADAEATCLGAGGCITGQDGGLNLTSNYPLHITGALLSLSGAWQGKSANTLLDLQGPRGVVVQPEVVTGSEGQCPAAVVVGGSYAFDADTKCTCPAGANCTARPRAALESATATYLARQGQAVALDVPPAVPAMIETSCASATRLDPVQNKGPWVIRATGGLVTPTKLRALNALTDPQAGCIGDGSSSATPALLLSGVFRFGDGAVGSAMAPGTAPNSDNTWTIGAKTSSLPTIVGGTPVLAADGTTIIECDTSTAGVDLQFSGASYVSVQTARILLCPTSSGGTVIAAPTAASGAGFVWQGSRTSPLLQTVFGHGGEYLHVHGLVFAPAAHAVLGPQGNSTGVSFDGGVVLRALTLTSNPSAPVQGDIAMVTPSGTADRTVQLRLWDVTRNQDLGIVEIAIHSASASATASGYIVKVWRTSW